MNGSCHTAVKQRELRVPILILRCKSKKEMYHLFTRCLFCQSLEQTTFKRRLIPAAAGGRDTMDHTGALDTEDELGPLAHLAPSPQSEAVAHEFQELSLQSSQHLPPLNERKNGEFSVRVGACLVSQRIPLVVICWSVPLGSLFLRRESRRGASWF